MAGELGAEVVVAERGMAASPDERCTRWLAESEGEAGPIEAFGVDVKPYQIAPATTMIDAERIKTLVL
ncbi:MAG: hypothetical protein BSK19_07440 [Stenotrophomonas maltophilia]|nr:MAG: hypothetical protein BSK19_07440 [Stenotrophomonas maltophilia]